ncbi:MltR family transcriptional regulator [Nitrobacter sp. TKz-YC01]
MEEENDTIFGSLNRLAGVVGELDDQLATCQKRLVELDEELKSASGERWRFLRQLRYQWEGSGNGSLLYL